MIVSHRRKFIFVHIHKTAGESITEALLPFLGRGDLLLGTTFRGELSNAWYSHRHTLQKHSGARKVRGFVGPAVWDDYLSFSFVRDPYDRVRSLYFYFERMLAQRRQRSLRNALLWLPGTDFRDPLKWPGMRAFLETESFSGFIRHPEFSPAIVGARRQTDLLCDREGRLLVDFVGRYDSLQQDFARLADRLGLEGATLGWRNASRNRASGADPDEAADRAHIAAIYRSDYETFGFPAPGDGRRASQA
jgi:Sulfotransferase family